MKYPAIYQSVVNESVFLLFNDKQGVVLDKSETAASTTDKWVDFAFTNITAEYLANTYGEVKSKEHAEFIKLLAENAGIDVFPQLLDANHFVIKGKLSFYNCESITSSELKQITIPLPPECDGEDKKPCEVISNGSIYKLSESGFYALTGNGKAGVIYESASLDNLMKAEDFKVLSFTTVDAEVKDDEWPKVGSSVEWGHTGKGEVKSLSDGLAWIKREDKEYTTVYISSLRKPKTPEQIIQENLINIYESSLDGGHFVDNLLSEYTLTKKPQ